MKRLLPLLVADFSMSMINAQTIIFEETFESGTYFVLPAGWVSQDLDADGNYRQILIMLFTFYLHRQFLLHQIHLY